jgi:hypothetical protein
MMLNLRPKNDSEAEGEENDGDFFQFDIFDPRYWDSLDLLHFFNHPVDL